jgi:hypothetical protein
LLIHLFPQFTWDPDKDRTNLLKHGISLAAGTALDLATATVLVDQRRDYGEVRYQAYGPIEDRLHVLVFTVRNRDVRLISLRKANAKEVRRYARG